MRRCIQPGRARLGASTAAQRAGFPRLMSNFGLSTRPEVRTPPAAFAERHSVADQHLEPGALSLASLGRRRPDRARSVGRLRIIAWVGSGFGFEGSEV